MQSESFDNGALKNILTNRSTRGSRKKSRKNGRVDTTLFLNIFHYINKSSISTRGSRKKSRKNSHC